MKKILIVIILITIILLIINYNKKPINNYDSMKGIWIADGTQFIYTIGYKNGEKIYSSYDSPYSLTIDGQGNYKLKMDDKLEEGTYSFVNEKFILKNSDNLITEICEFKNNIELHCDKYASLYIKQ